ncbi:PKD domain-containing protein [Pedobacter polaris]|uniref:PKD domain-containing protein n=1 Tax=Pedobacter polaris TaxID=2571273 RepID=A0A4U1CSB7_9SPHI|nr:PKD domain-containing protein [Pedobacter polaris]TKC10644.1 PKD domain-containing protein [Pedobacter polaris]
MKNFYLIILLFLLAGFYNSANAQNISNEGMEFWTVFPTHDPSSSSLATMNVNVTSKFDSEVTVTCGSWSSGPTPTPIPANTVVTFLVPRLDSYINSSEANTLLSNRGIHIVVTPGKPKVVAYSHVFAGFRSAATLILPYEALGQKYYSMNYTQDRGDGESKGFLTLVAADDNTNLILHKNDGSTITIPQLNKGDVYEYMPSIREDLTGVFVEVNSATSNCKRFAAFSGSTSISIGCSGSRDPLLQQLYSLNSWGKTYGIVPFINRRYIIRVLAQEDGTKIFINGVNVATRNKGLFYESEILTAPAIVSGDKLISVAQYSLSQACSSTFGGAMTGDPEMVLLNPTEFNIKNITVFSSEKNLIGAKYINVFIKTNKVSTFKLNGNVPNGTWQTMPSDPTYSYLQLQVFDESLTLTADDGFNAIAYGFGQTESYAYSAGTNLASTQFLVLVNKATGSENAAACLGEASDFKLTLPYKLDKLIWKYGDGTADSEIDNPSFTTSGTDPILYIYRAPVSKTFTVVGKTQLTAIATLASTAGSCSTSEIELNFTFDVDPLPTAEFEMATIGCTGDEISFTDKSLSNVNGKNITAWQWDFGDGTPISTEQNPKHIFNTTGNITVKLSVSAENGCFSDIKPHDIFINPKPTALFSPSNITCIDNDILFTDQSQIIGGNIIKWTWDFGDSGSTSNTSSLQNPTHKYSNPGTYNVKLTVETDKACVHSLTLPVTINDLPKVEFNLPEVCLDAGVAVFKNNSTDFDGSTNSLTYAWDFGDTEPGAINNTSTLRDGYHAYTVAKEYTVTLTVTNAKGCKVIKMQKIAINNSNPSPNFEKNFTANACSNQSFSLKNTSTVPGFGAITRLEWYFNGILELTDEEPTPNQIYTFTKPKFTTPQTKDIVVTLKVFTGDALACSRTSAPQTITLLASPEVEFNALNPICLNRGVVQLVATETGNLQGDGGVFTGNGVSPTGSFNPLLAGVGKHDITYTFTADNGCRDQKVQTIEVYSLPTIDVGNDFYILAGGEKQFNASATGIGLTYEWTPSIGLSNPNILNPIANPAIDTKYMLKVTSSQGCTVFDDIYVYVLQNVKVPNTFTPNGDGVNDVWNIQYLDTYPNGTVEIFDRNGQRVYVSSKGYSNPFDGTYRNQPLPVGTYYYIINPNSGRKNITGNLTIIR